MPRNTFKLIGRKSKNANLDVVIGDLNCTLLDLTPVSKIAIDYWPVSFRRGQYEYFSPACEHRYNFEKSKYGLLSH